ncbi:MAG: TIGR00725 family protein [Dehalococcoidia bacterium]|nr:TIGR00725 family protein [Dehalococcoidia bacterium]
MLIGVIGESNSSPELLRQAEEVGRELGKRGVWLICGGLGGVMEAACRGAKGAGGQTIGIIPGDRGCGEKPNPYVDVPIYTGMGQARNIIIVKSALAVVAVGGRYGTLSEIALALSHGIPVVGLRTWELGKEGIPDQSVHRAGTAAEAVEKALSLAEKARTV